MSQHPYKCVIHGEKLYFVVSQKFDTISQFYTSHQSNLISTFALKNLGKNNSHGTLNTIGVYIYIYPIYHI